MVALKSRHKKAGQSKPASGNSRGESTMSPASKKPMSSFYSVGPVIFLGAPVQRKLTIGAPDDMYEKEADNVADQVMRMPDSIADPADPTPGPSAIQRKSTCSQCSEEPLSIQTKSMPTPSIAQQITPLVQRQVENEEEEQAGAQPEGHDLIQRQENEEEEEQAGHNLIQRQENDEEVEEAGAQTVEHGSIQRQENDEEVEEAGSKPTGQELIQRQENQEEDEEQVQTKSVNNQAAQAGNGLHRQIQSMRSAGGQPLPQSSRDFFEPRFGRSFSNVRVHTDNRAANTAKSINARAFTIGRDLVFGSGEYVPGSQSGRQLLAHELTHVIQQGASSPNATQPVAPKMINRKPFPTPTIKHVSKKPVVRLWSRSGNTATVNRQGDVLWDLASSITGHGRDWACIFPIRMKNPAAPYWKHLRIGDQFDVSNLTATAGANLTLRMDTTGALGTVYQNFYGGTAATTGAAVTTQLETASGQGDTPIHTFLIAGHSAAAWGEEMRADPASANNFNVSGLDPELPTPTFARANARQGPRRCWFTKSANARAVGCNSQTFAGGFAAVFLRRRGTNINATNRTITGRTTPAPAHMTMTGSPTQFFNAGALAGAPGLWVVIPGTVV